MKLEVGQKIGIYEALTDGDFSYKPLVIGNQYLGFSNYKGVDLIDEEIDVRFMFSKEVRKVASLTVKAVK